MNKCICTTNGLIERGFTKDKIYEYESRVDGYLVCNDSNINILFVKFLFFNNFMRIETHRDYLIDYLTDIDT